MAAFKEETSKSTKLSDCFKNPKSLHDQVAGWKKNLDSSIRKNQKDQVRWQKNN